MGASQSQPSSENPAVSKHRSREDGQFLQQFKEANTRASQAQLQNSMPINSQYSNQLNRGGLSHLDSPAPNAVAPGSEQENMPLFYWLGMAAWNQTRGTATVDLMRPKFPELAPGGSLFHAKPAKKRRSSRFQQGDQFVSSASGYGDDSSPFGLYGRSTGARIKIMRSIQIGRPRNSAAAPPSLGLLPQGAAPSVDPVNHAMQSTSADTTKTTTSTHGVPRGDAVQIQSALKTVQAKIGAELKAPQRPLLDVGAGLTFDLDSANASALVRLKVKDWFSVRLLPNQVFKINKRWQLGNSPVALRVNYECPLSHLDDPFRAPARLMIRMENAIGRNVHLTPSGINFDEHVFRLGQGTVVRAAGSVIFPRQLPVEEGENLINFRVQRFGLKALW